jgi:HD superfamily phosphodiesterase
MKFNSRMLSVCTALTSIAGGLVSPPVAHAQPAALASPAATKQVVAGVAIPHSKLARDASALAVAAEGELLFQHSMRVYCWAALAAKRKGLTVDPQLLFVAAMFHDFGLTSGYASSHLRYEVDGANAARDFLLEHGLSESDAQKVWFAIALHTTNGISAHVSPLADLIAEGANMDLVGLGFDEFAAAERDGVEAAYPRPDGFAEEFLQTLYDSLKHRPETTQGTGLADVLADKDPQFRRRDFTAVMRNSPWTRTAR